MDTDVTGIQTHHPQTQVLGTFDPSLIEQTRHCVQGLRQRPNRLLKRPNRPVVTVVDTGGRHRYRVVPHPHKISAIWGLWKNARLRPCCLGGA